MSGRNGYANGYGYPDAGQYDGGYDYGSSDGLGINGYSGSAGRSGRDYRAGGYGGFYQEPPPPQPSMMPTQSPERRRERIDRGRQDRPSSRSRTRDGDERPRLQPSRDGLHPDWYAGRIRERGQSEASNGGGDARGTQAVEGLKYSTGDY